jgi:hypothetical protein
MFRLLCEFDVDELNCNFVSGVFYNVFRGENFDYMK